MEEFNKRNERKDSKSREGVDRVEDTKKDKEEHDKEEKTRQGNSNKKTEGRRTGRTDKQKEKKELPGLVFVEDEEQQEQPEQLLFEVKESKRKKKTKKKTASASKVKDEIKLALVSMYALAGATLDDCFYLKPNEADLLTEAIYRYLEEHNLIHTISEKSATFNLIVALVSVNLPKFTVYYKNLKQKREGGNNDEEGKTKIDSRQSVNGSGGTEHDSNNAKAYLTEFYSTNGG